jgi:hypothetical protein
MICQAKPTFPHRHNNDGVIDSICSECLVTIASARVEQELTPHEDAHICDLNRLYELGADPFRRPSLDRSYGTY